MSHSLDIENKGIFITLPSPLMIPPRPDQIISFHMASTIGSHPPSPLTKLTLMDSNASTSENTAHHWDEYEKRAKDNAKKREMKISSEDHDSHAAQSVLNGNVLDDIIKSYGPMSSPGTPHFTSSSSTSPKWDFSFHKASQRKINSEPSPTTVAICKSCHESINSARGICEKCVRTIRFNGKNEMTTPPASPIQKNFTFTELPKLRKNSMSEETSPTSSPRCRPHRSPTHQLIDPPIRLSSLQSMANKQQPSPSHSQPLAPRKHSLAEPGELSIRLHATRKCIPTPTARTQPSSPTTPPPTSYPHTPTHSSNPCTRRSSLANVTTPPCYIRHDSATPSELSTLFPYMSNSTTPPSVGQASNALQTTTSAWDEWDSDGEGEEKIGLVGYWRGRKWSRSRGSPVEGGARRESVGKEDSVHEGRRGETREKEREKEKGKVRGFVRVISCGCGE
ncbi:hypothetical protein B0J11DRAFT_567581 [Dendryphion nanum]|uniref:Uncharacterized protein n=1 Tax=Dendryphion nanum TaxID=256645 RepID=A0A9P9IPR5_9PLEO|nr:hypothetical protein B0J11DRAFT_567581 [Dendryphion nanum]